MPFRKLPLLLFLPALLSALVLGGCSSKEDSVGYMGGRYRGTKSYTVRGKTYHPYKSARGYRETGVASWYGPGFHGKKTSNGERYDQNAMTAAHKLLPFGTRLQVTNLNNGRSIVVRINDRGPFVGSRIIDLSKEAARQLHMIGSGTARVKLVALGEGNREAEILTPEGDMLETAYAFDIPLEDGSVRSITVVYYDCYYENIEYIFEMTAYDGDYETAQYLLNEMVQTVDIWSAPGY